MSRPLLVIVGGKRGAPILSAGIRAEYSSGARKDGGGVQILQLLHHGRGCGVTLGIVSGSSA